MTTDECNSRVEDYQILPIAIKLGVNANTQSARCGKLQLLALTARQSASTKDDKLHSSQLPIAGDCELNLKPNEVKLTKFWQHATFLVFATATSVALLPMLLWPQSGVARLFCVVSGSIGMTAMAVLLGASIRIMFAQSTNAETDAS